jgi:hypothetical protein
VIVDTNGNFFGGFTPVEWESREWKGGQIGREDNRRKGDMSCRSFLFTVRNPHGVPPRIFRLKQKRCRWAIDCDADWGPSFCDLAVGSGCSLDLVNATGPFGNSYTNDTGFAASKFFTGASNFRVEEIQVFEITDR